MNRSIIFATLGALVMVLFGMAQFQPAHAASKKGSFSSHKSYKVKGTATVTESGGKTVIKLTGFSTTPGPDLYVYVGKGSPTTRIAKLKANKGSQTYALPASVKLSSISTVHIHCKRFSSTFATAKVN